MYYCSISLGVLEYTPQISCHFNIILNCKLVRFGVYMVKLCHEKMLIFRCILPQKTTPRKQN